MCEERRFPTVEFAAEMQDFAGNQVDKPLIF